MEKRSVGKQTDIEQRLTLDLRHEADRAVPLHTDLWPGILREAQGDFEHREIDSRRRRTAKPWRARTRLGWVAVLSAMVLIGGGAYAAAGLLGLLDDTYGEAVPYVHEHELGTPVGAERSHDGVTVTVDRVYADSAYVAVGYTVEGLRKLGDPVQISSDMKLSEPGGPRDDGYEIADGFWGTLLPGEGNAPQGAEAGTVVFETPKTLEAGRSRRFRAAVEISGPVGPVPENGAFKTERLGRPFILEFEIPVREASVVDVEQTVEANGVPITLSGVVNSPAKTRAYLCFDPPRGTFDYPVVKTRLLGGERMADAPVTDGKTTETPCAIFVFDEVLYGEPGAHSLTVNRLVANDPKVKGTVHGPWRFRFKIPEPVFR